MIKPNISSKMSYSTSIFPPSIRATTTKMEHSSRKNCDNLAKTTFRFVISSLFVFLITCHSSDAAADDTLYLYDDDLYDTNYFYEEDYNSALTKYYKENPRTVDQHGQHSG